MGTPAHLVLGTAGHIDHGKTALVRALTGFDTDRLPEEKRRGITITLGFAPLDLANGTRVAVVDVPGHERFVKNMVAGASGIDLVLLVVAADEGVMPQTREHVEICELLGIEHGVVALTKVDRAGEELSALAREDTASYLADSFLASAPVVPCSSTTGEGLDTLRDALATALARVAARPTTEPAVMAIDRMFSAKGFGSVVTGTLLAGSIAVGDQIEIVPAVPGRPLPAAIRVRSVEVFHEKVDRAHAGDRTALSLSGVELDQLARGQLVIEPGSSRPTRSFDARIRLLPSRAKPLKSGARVLLHIGTAIREAGLTLLDADRLEPGQSSVARVRLCEPIAALPGQRFILRGFEAISTAGRTVGGGVVLDPEPPRRRRFLARTRQTLETLADARTSKGEIGFDAAVMALVQEHGVRGVEIAALSRRLGTRESQTGAAIARARGIVRLGSLAVDRSAIEGLSTPLLALVNEYHKAHPFRAAIPLTELASSLAEGVPTAVIEESCRSLVLRRELALGSEGLSRPQHRPFRESRSDARVTVLALIDAAGLEPPTPEAIEEKTKLGKKTLAELLAALSKNGEVVHAGPKIYFSARAFADAKQAILTHLSAEGEITTADAKAITQVSRRFLIPLLETLDRMRVTVRVGEVRKAR